MPLRLFRKIFTPLKTLSKNFHTPKICCKCSPYRINEGPSDIPSYLRIVVVNFHIHILRVIRSVEGHCSFWWQIEVTTTNCPTVHNNVRAPSYVGCGEFFVMLSFCYDTIFRVHIHFWNTTGKNNSNASRGFEGGWEWAKNWRKICHTHFVCAKIRNLRADLFLRTFHKTSKIRY